MSAEVAAVVRLPAAAVAARVAGAGFVVARGAAVPPAGWVAADRIARVLAGHSLLAGRIARARALFGEAVTPLPPLDPVPPAGLDPERAAGWAARAEETVARAGADFRDELLAARTRRVIDDAGADHPGVTPPVAASLERVLARMDGGLPPHLAAALHAGVVDALRAGPETTRLRRLDDLHWSVERANAEARRREATLGELTGRLAGFTGPAIDAAQAAIDTAAAAADPDLRALSQVVGTAIRATLAPLVRDLTRRAVRESLAGTGCTVEADPGGTPVLAVAHRNGRAELAVRVDGPDGDGLMHLHLVAATGSAAADRVLRALADRGLQVTETGRTVRDEVAARAAAPFQQRRRNDRWTGARRHGRELPR